MEVINNNNKEKDKVGGLLFVGCMFIGMGIGQYMGAISTGTLIGLGAGFLAMAVYRLAKKD